MRLKSFYAVGTMAGRPPTREAPAFGRKIADLRKKLGLTQAELAEQLNVTQQTVTHYERRTPNPSIDLLNRLAAFFDVPPATLLDQKEFEISEKPRRSTQLERAFESVKALPRSKQKVVVDFIESFARANT